MGQKHHDINEPDLVQGYERNEIELKGILYFGIGLFLLIVITFWLMWALYGVLETDVGQRQASDNPMAPKAMDRLPPEPRLQGAPGFGVDSPQGRVNLELVAPQSEYWELKKQWDKVWKEGVKHPETGVVIAMPIDDAIDKLIEQGLPAKSGPDVENKGVESRRVLTDASSGRKASLKRR
jgi:hypothetical protein